MFTGRYGVCISAFTVGNQELTVLQNNVYRGISRSGCSNNCFDGQILKFQNSCSLGVADGFGQMTIILRHI